MDFLCFTVNQMLLYTVVMVCVGFAITVLAFSAFVSFVRNSFPTDRKGDNK